MKAFSKTTTMTVPLSLVFLAAALLALVAIPAMSSPIVIDGGDIDVDALVNVDL